MQGLAVVLRPFDGDGRRHNPGEMVDVTDWPLADKLVDHRYIRPATPEEVLAFKGIEGALAGASTPAAVGAAGKRGREGRKDL